MADHKTSINVLTSMITQHTNTIKNLSRAKFMRNITEVNRLTTLLDTSKKRLFEYCQTLYLHQIQFRHVLIKHRVVLPHEFDEIHVDMAPTTIPIYQTMNMPRLLSHKRKNIN